MPENPQAPTPQDVTERSRLEIMPDSPHKAPLNPSSRMGWLRLDLVGGFRSRLLLSLLLVVLLTTGLVSGLAYWRFSNVLAHDDWHSLENSSLIMTHALLLSPEKAQIDPQQVDNLSQIGHTRFRVVRDNQVSFEVGGRFPENSSGWRFLSKPLEHGFVLQAAYSSAEAKADLQTLLRTELLALPLSLAIAMGVAWFLFGYLMRPIHTLTEATQELSQQRFPKPMAIPAGNDELSDLARSFNHMSLAIQGYLERERSFTRYASHELRTPLATLRMQFEALEQGLLSQDEVLPVVKTSLGRLERILAGLLELSRRPQSEPEALEVGEILQMVLSNLNSNEQGRVRVSGPLHTQILGYELLLQQALGNLVHNALKFSQSGVEITIEPSSQVDIVVRDRGPGVPAEKLSQLGEPFVRLQSQVPGIGLGLALVRHVADVLGGCLEFTNRPDGGLEARLSLPKAGAGYA